VFACFVDFQKAFDKVIHTGIKLKLLEIGVSSRFYNIIKKHVRLNLVEFQRYVLNNIEITLQLKIKIYIDEKSRRKSQNGDG
jgi:hypothetical protein